MRQTVIVVRTFQPPSSRWVSLVLSGALLFGLGCGSLVPKKSTGEKLYRKYCADCHGVDGRGQTIRYMGNPTANLMDGSWKYGAGDNMAIQQTVRQGLVERHPASLRRLDSEQVEEIADWVLKLRGEISR